MGSRLFVESFMAKVFHEDVGMIFNPPSACKSLGNFCDYFIVLCLVLWLLFHIVFPSLGILQHYVRFNICTITTLEKLFGVRSFGVSITHLICRQTTFPIFSNRFDFFFIIQTIAFTLLGCWAPINLPFVNRF
jgi:hypothetical protein